MTNSEIDQLLHDFVDEENDDLEVTGQYPAVLKNELLSSVDDDEVTKVYPADFKEKLLSQERRASLVPASPHQEVPKTDEKAVNKTLDSIRRAVRYCFVSSKSSND